MSATLKNFSDEELEWRAKKIRNVRIEHAKINEINKARAKSKPLVSYKQFALNNPAKAKLLQREKLINNGYEVMFKITSHSQNFNHLILHIDYMSREGKLELLDSDLNCYTTKEDMLYCLENYQNGYVIPKKNESKREKRETYNMVFSMHDYEDCDSTSLRDAAFETIKKMYPNTYFTLLSHTDTDNPHCHICLKATNYDGSRIDIKKADCTAIRKAFAANLNKRGIYALATRRSDKIRGRAIANNITQSTEPKTLHEYKAKPHYYRILDFGEAPYNDDILNKPSYFISYYTRRGNITIWGKNLKEIVEDSKLQKGEYARIKKIGYELQPYQFDKLIKGQIYTISTQRKIAKWDISILNRAEKSFIKLPKVKIKTTMNLKEPLLPQSKDSLNDTKALHKHYTKQEWARFYADKKAKLQELTQRSNNEQSSPRKYTREQWARYKTEQKRGSNTTNRDREQWARFYTTRHAALHKPNTPAFRDSPKPYANMCAMPKSNVACQQRDRTNDTAMLLSSHAQHNPSSYTTKPKHTTRTESKERDNDRAL